MVSSPGSGGAASDLLAGRVQVYLGAIASLSQFIRNDLMTALAVSGSQRQPSFPNVATLAEQGVAGFDSFTIEPVFYPKLDTKNDVVKTDDVSDEVRLFRVDISFRNNKGTSQVPFPVSFQTCFSIF